MRRLVLILLLLFPAFLSDAAAPYFLTGKDTRLNYVRRNASNDKVVWTYVVSVDSVYVGGLDFTYDFHRPGGSQMYGGPLKMSMLVSENGDVTMDVAATVKTFVHNIFPKADVWSEGGQTLLPASMGPGDILPDVFARAKVAGLHYNVSITGRSVLRREAVTTPAGTFECVVVEEHKVESGLGRNRDIRTLTWYATGVGEIKHESYDWNTQKLLTVEVLESIE